MKTDNNKQTAISKAIKWWENTVLNDAERVEWKVKLTHKYFGDYNYTNLTDAEILYIHKAENSLIQSNIPLPTDNSKEETVKGKEVDNLFTGGKWIVRELQTKETDFEIITDEPKGQNNNGYVAYIHGGGYTVPNQAKANAQRIVLCHNVHDELVSALENCITDAEQDLTNGERLARIKYAKELLSRIKQ